LWALGICGACVALWLLASWAVACRLTGRAKAIRPEPPPAVAWGELEEVRLTTSDGEEIGGWFAEGKAGKPVVLLLHGNGASRAGCLGPAEMVASVGCPVMLISLRAHGDSSGDVNDFGYSARHDVIAAVEWLKKRMPGRPIMVWGQSLGSAAALFASAELGERVDGYILECPYRDLWTAVRNRTQLYFPPVVELAAYSGLALVGPAVLPHADRICPVEAASGVRGRALVLAGGADGKARPEEAREIAERIGESAELVVFEGAGHMKLSKTDPERYRDVVMRFLCGACP
jgi:pimeloyl-ACP methyl ester carboxylesterase